MHNSSEAVASKPVSDTRIIVFEAIAKRQIVATCYNGEQLKLAPHCLFERHGDLFVRALNLNKTWRVEEDPRLGQFKLAGLVGTELLDEPFEPLPAYEAALPRPDDNLILTV